MLGAKRDSHEAKTGLRIAGSDVQNFRVSGIRIFELCPTSSSDGVTCDTFTKDPLWVLARRTSMQLTSSHYHHVALFRMAAPSTDQGKQDNTCPQGDVNMMLDWLLVPSDGCSCHRLGLKTEIPKP